MCINWHMRTIYVLLTPLTTVFLARLIFSQLVKKFPSFMEPLGSSL
jgi:hypothetical protein